MRKGRRGCRLVSGRWKRRDLWPVVLAYIGADQGLHASGVEGDVAGPPCVGPFDPDEGVASVTMAYVLLIHLMVVCPLIRLLSVSMKENAKRR